jgi:hypothetical protein
MSVTVTKEIQTKDGLLRETSRTWVTSNGHVVTILTSTNTTCLTTWGGRNNAFANVQYVCECGKSKLTTGLPKKSELDSHDSWFTAEERATHTATLLALLGN